MKTRSRRLRFLSVVPSPYQRDLFAAIDRAAEESLVVYYLEHAAPDSPWPTAALAPWERVLPGWTLGRRRWRSHFNWRLPRLEAGELWVINGAMTDVTTQVMMRRLGRKGSWCFWGEIPSSAKKAPKRWLQRWQYAPLKQAEAIVAVGRRAEAAYRRLVPAVPIYNQPYTCRLDTFKAAALARQWSGEPVFLFCGQMIARKGIDLLLQAFATLVERGQPGRLLLIGREAGLPPLLAKLNPPVCNRIEYAGFQAPEDLPAWFARADIFVLPSRHDGWGVVVNQALAAGLPVISSDAVGAGVDLVRPGENGLIVPAGNSAALYEAMARLAGAPDFRRACGSAAARTAEHLHPEIAARFWIELAQRDNTA